MNTKKANIFYKSGNKNWLDSCKSQTRLPKKDGTLGKVCQKGGIVKVTKLNE